MHFNANEQQLPFPDNRPRADYTVIGGTESLCPQCLTVVPTKIVLRGKRVYFRKWCAEHGVREDFVCSDVHWWDRPEGQTPSVLPVERSTTAKKGCPYDCGLCEEHEQHTCIGIVELTDNCNLTCPMCYASSRPGLLHHSMDKILASLDRLVAIEGRAEVCQLSGGEPSLHPQFCEIVDAALSREIDYVMINTNGIRLAKDERLLAFLAERKRRIEIYLQFDGQDAEYVTRLRGAELNEIKQQAIEKLEEYDVNTTLVATLTAPVPQRLYQQVFDTAMAHKNITGISLQPATYSGRYLEPRDLEDRVTFPDCIEALSRCSNGMLQADDFAPLPCAHPNCHQILLAARSGKMIVPLSRYAEISQNLDLLAGGISFTREKSQELVERFLSRASNCGSGCECGSNTLQTFQIGRENQAKDKLSIASLLNDPADETSQILRDFFAKVLRQEASAQDLLRITITSFLDIYNFDIRQLIKCCTHHVLPTGHVVPFCAYNSLYRPGHLQLPDVSTAVIRTQHIN